MKVSWKWINELIDIQNISLNEIVKKLILAGFEIEEIIDKPEIKDKTIDISITNNREDASSIVGIIREISTLFNIKMSKSFHNIQTIQNYHQLDDIKSNAILDLKLTTITNVKQNKSPLWLKNYLIGCDIEPINILYDIKEYIRIKWGQDIEIFDLDKINPNNTNDAAINIEKLKNQDDWMNMLNSDNLQFNRSLEILKYNHEILSIIGIESNPYLQYDIKTSSILIVGQVCQQKYIKQITEKLKNKTDTSNRNLKYVSINDLMYAYNETIQLILSLSTCNIKSEYRLTTNHSIEKQISVDKQDIIDILGPLKHNYKPLSNMKILKILTQLNFQPQYRNDHFLVSIPEHRQVDLQRSIDVIEEIGRVYGFDKFFDTIPQYYQKGNISSTIQYIDKIRHILSNLGLHEIINYSLEDKFIKDTSKIELYNTLIEDQSQLKDNLIKDLIITKQYNISKKNTFLEFFEIGRVFHKQKISLTENSYIETLNIAGIIGNDHFSRRLWKEKAQSMSWFQAKGLLEDFFEQLNININWVKPTNNTDTIISNYWSSICHPYRTSILYNKETKEPIGIFSELNTKYNTKINSNHQTYIFELNLFNLIKNMKIMPHLSYIYKPYSNYPIVSRDISLKLNKNETAKSIEEQILAYNNSLIKSVEIFNEYNDQNYLNKHRNIGLRITYQSKLRTLSDKDIENIDNEINQLLKSKNKKDYNRE